MAGIVFGFLAGLLSTLSPCVLPLLPLVLGPASAAHRFGPAALAAGMALSYVAIGLLIGTVGFALGLDADVFRAIAASLLLVMGVVLVSEGLQARFAFAAGGVGNAGNRIAARIPRFGRNGLGSLGGQFALGILLGAIWSPCVGPTLGAASLLAAQGRDLGHVALLMAAFGIGAALPLLALGTLSRGLLLRVGTSGKRVLGVATIAIAALILTGADRPLEAALVTASPSWLTALTTAY